MRRNEQWKPGARLSLRDELGLPASTITSEITKSAWNTTQANKLRNECSSHRVLLWEVAGPCFTGQGAAPFITDSSSWLQAVTQPASGATSLGRYQ